jgi:hypothetical protein
MALTAVKPVFPDIPRSRGMYESFYLRAVAPAEPLGIWIRYTVHKPPGQPPRGSLWCTVFDLERRGPYMHKLTTDALAVPADGWIAVGDSSFGPQRAEGTCGAASWSLGITPLEPELRHLPRAWMYRAPLPRTKLSSPAPAALFDGTLVLSDPPARTIDLSGWRGMVGHNWGAEHAERWIWLHGIGFEDGPEWSTAARDTNGASGPAGRDSAGTTTPPWLDVAIGRICVAGRTTPWVANGALSLDGERHQLGGLTTAHGLTGRLLVAETPEHCRLSLPGTRGLMVEAHVQSPSGALAGWRYADPDDSDRSRHDVSNCSIATVKLTANRPGLPARTLHTAHGGVYELGMRERDHGVPIAPFTDD